MAFLHLYARAQNRLNGFTARHLDFYYRQILKLNTRKQTPESYYLLLGTLAGREKIRVEKNTEFSAGKDVTLSEIIYSADEDLLVSDARVESIATLYLQQDELVFPEAELGFVTRIKSNLPRPLPSMALDAEPEQRVSWPLFGAEQPWGKRGTTTDARIGFAIASSVLLLEEGSRKIQVTIEFESVVKAIADAELAELLASNSEEKFDQLFSRLFARYLLNFQGCLTAQQKIEISARAAALLEPTRASKIESLLLQDWQDLFYKLFDKVFRKIVPDLNRNFLW